VNTITRPEVLDVLTKYFYPILKKTEDIESFTRTVSCEMRKLSADVLTRAIEAFDAEIRASVPFAWKVKDRPPRTVITLLGQIRYSRTLFIDEYGRARYLTDEILGISKRSRFSDDAFLWIVNRAAYVSFRRTAQDFHELSDATISPVGVMKMVHKEGMILKEYLLSERHGSDKICQDRLFVEADGVFVALQSESKRKQAIARHLYESSRYKHSVEIKCALSYAGKTQAQEPTKKVRGNVLSVCTVGDKNELFAMVAADIKHHYDASEVKVIISASDGAACYRDHGLDDEFPQASFAHCLDPFHIVRALTAAFPNQTLRSKLLSMVFSSEIEGFSALCTYLEHIAETEAEQLKIAECKRYIRNNAENIRPKISLGTMEGTISHIWAKRMKNNATSWSRKGAEAMALIRSFLCCKRDLIAPVKQVFFTEVEKERKMGVVADAYRNRGYAQPEGSGYLPYQASAPLAKAPGRYLPGSFRHLRVR